MFAYPGFVLTGVLSIKKALKEIETVYVLTGISINHRVYCIFLFSCHKLIIYLLSLITEFTLIICFVNNKEFDFSTYCKLPS